ncbi:hypothetical protein BO70DRAFT_396781 [Aspergillus heteromorphus CBS 117.55]|uniref:Uncharacterized protein n=1 Tax=Aspergillus heteromorphus CBS 117.55 TaxID=1448321 RepID=A0A317W386_9EURO|nr:uncharacterized protein BO70DRAFT_396781 [Aspergillus heteromorphus CBS 117.55]PWY80475.1 hypothetical protein BO70DRAFT_396781 [Aspergillus heteromorphus CBS 117.55]
MRVIFESVLPWLLARDHVGRSHPLFLKERSHQSDIAKPTTMIAHLVNIEHVETMTVPVTKDFVAMSSLL